MLQDEGRPKRGIPAHMEGRQDHPTVALAAQESLFRHNDPGDVGFAHRGPYEAATALHHRVGHHQGGREVGDHDGRRSGGPGRGQYRPCSYSERVVLADRSAGLIDQRQPVDVGIHRHAEIRPALADQLAQGAEIFRDRLGLPRETSVGLEVDATDLHAKAGEERQHRRSASTANAIERNVELAMADRRDVDFRQGEDCIEMSLDRAIVARYRTHRAPVGAGRTCFGKVSHRGARACVKKDSVRSDKLHRVPFNGVVTCGEDQTGTGVMMLDGHLHRWSGCHTDVDDVDADRLKTRGGGASEHFARSAGIATEHDAGAAIGSHPGAERGCVASDEFRREVLANDATHAGDGDHQSIRHRSQN